MDSLNKDALLNALQTVRDYEQTIIKHEATISNLQSELSQSNANHAYENADNLATIQQLKSQIEQLQPAYNLLHDPELIQGYQAIQPIVTEPIATTPSTTATLNTTTSNSTQIVNNIINSSEVQVVEGWFKTFRAELAVLWQEIKAAWNKFRQGNKIS
jgi:hypothetical protein